WANQTRMLRIRPSAPLLACLSGVLGLASVACGSAASGAAAAGVGASARAAAPFTGNPFASGPLYRAPYSNAENALKQTQQADPAGARLLAKIAAQPQASWYGGWSGDIATVVRNY